jgi:hypothetical protein
MRSNTLLSPNKQIMLEYTVSFKYDPILQPGVVSNKLFYSNVSAMARWIKKSAELLQKLHMLFYASDFIIDISTAHFKSD